MSLALAAPAPAAAPPPLDPAEREPALSEYHRAQLRVAAEHHVGAQLQRATVLAALRAAGLPMPPHPAVSGTQRLLSCVGAGRETIMVWQEEAQLLLDRLPAPEPAPRHDLATRRGLLGIARECFARADELAGPDARVRDAFNRIGERILGLAADLQDAEQQALVSRATRLLGAGVMPV